MNIKMLKELDFASIVSEAKPVTESGRSIIKKYAGYLFTNESNYNLVNNFIHEARLHAYDKGLMLSLNKIASFIDENKNSWALATACENVSLQRPAFNCLIRNAVKQIDNLLENCDENQVTQYIKAGALKNVQYVPEFRAICKGVFSEQITDVEAPNFNISAPLTYTEIVDEGVYFQVGGYTYLNKNGIVTEAASPGRKFDKLNKMLESFTKNEESIEYTWAPKNIKFEVFENGTIEVTRNEKKETFESYIDFDEWRDNTQRGMISTPQKIEFMTVSENVKEIAEAMENIAEADCARILRTSKGDVVAIVEATDNILVNTMFSYSGNSYKSYPNAVEALTAVEKKTGVNLQCVFESRIERETKEASDKEMRELRKELNERKIQERRERIEAYTDKYKNNPMKLAILNNLSRELSKL